MSTHPSRPAAPKVLIADDHHVHRMLAATLFAALDCEVEVACDGREAVLFALAEPFDLIILDRNMPRCGGDEAAIMIRAPVSLSKDALLICHSTVPPCGSAVADYDAIAPKPLTTDDALRLLALRRHGMELGYGDLAEKPPTAFPPRSPPRSR